MSVNEKMTTIADAIRAKTGKTDALTLDQMVTEIEGITTGGGGGGSGAILFHGYDSAAFTVLGRERPFKSLSGCDYGQRFGSMLYLDRSVTSEAHRPTGRSSALRSQKEAVGNRCATGHRR